MPRQCQQRVENVSVPVEAVPTSTTYSVIHDIIDTVMKSFSYMTTPLILFFLLLTSCSSFDSRDIKPSEWVCGTTLSATFTDGTIADCNSEVLRPIALTMPTIFFFNSSAAPSTTYTLLIIDRDAPNATVPLRGPLRHAAFSHLSQRILRSGINWSTLNNSSNDSAIALFNYSGPGPSVGSGCHRYYIMLYSEAIDTPLPFLYDPSRYSMNFPLFASNFSLTKIASATTYWRTQNFEERIGPCETTPSSTPPPTNTKLGLGLGLGFGLGLPVTALLIYIFLKRSSKNFIGRNDDKVIAFNNPTSATWE